MTALPPVPHPPPITRGERFTLAFAGLVDCTRYRRIADGQHTHTSLRLSAEFSDGISAVRQWSTDNRAALQTARDELDRYLDIERNRSMARPVAELATASKRDRLEWADHNRRAAAIRRIDTTLAVLPDLAADAVSRWQAQYQRRLAIYARARFRGAVGTSTVASLPTLENAATTSHPHP